jgi:hypothetical protein
MTLCMMMTISLLWTISLLMAVGNDRAGKFNTEASLQTAVFYSWNATAFPPANSQNDVRSLSVGHDHGSPHGSDPGSGLDQTTSIVDYRPESETFLVDDKSIKESSSDHWKGPARPSPTFSSLSGTPTFTMAPSTTKCATTWTTHLPARSTSQPGEAYPPVILQSQRQSSARSPSSRILTDLKRTWSRQFNIGHLTMRITSLTIV